MSVDGLDGGRGPGDVGRARVNGSNHPTPYRYGIPLDRQRWKTSTPSERHDSYSQIGKLTIESEIPVARSTRDINVVDRSRV